MRRVWVRGASGAGKSTVAAVLADAMGVPHVMVDDLAFLPGWVHRPVAEVQARVREAMGDGGWVVDGNWQGFVEPVVAPLVDAVVWVDPPRPLVMARLVRRTVRRSLGRQVMYGGNRETLLRHLRVWDPDLSLWRFSWDQHAHLRRALPAEVAAMGGVRLIRLDLRGISAVPAPAPASR